MNSFTKNRGLLFFASILIMLSTISVFPQLGYTQFEDVDKDATRLALGVSGTRDGEAITGAFSAPYTVGNYAIWASVFANQITADSEVITQDLNAHVQAGRRWANGWGLEVFVDASRNTAAGESFNRQAGVFVRMGEYELTDWLEITGGVGTFAENAIVHEIFAIEENLDARKELGLDGTVSRALGLFSIDLFNMINTTVKITPEISFKDFQVELTPKVTFRLPVQAELTPEVTIQLPENLTLDIQVVLDYKSVPIAEKFNYSFSKVLAIIF
jgi:hypothetical protein